MTDNGNNRIYVNKNWVISILIVIIFSMTGLVWAMVSEPIQDHELRLRQVEAAIIRLEPVPSDIKQIKDALNIK